MSGFECATDTGAINWNNTGNSYTLYSGNYLNWKHFYAGASATKTRLQIVQEVFSDVMDSTSGVNAGLMCFDNKDQALNKGGYFLLPMQQLDGTSRTTFKSVVNGLTPGGYTPLAETMYEAARYYRGEGVEYRDDTDPGTNHTGVLDPADATSYKTPIEFQCQLNSIVMLTDGEPTYDSDADTLIQALPDIDADTLTDIIFAADVGGQVWRFDVDNSGTDSVITGGVVARLAGAGTDEHRRFYERPDVSLLKRSNGQLVYAVGIGSGYRAHPLDSSTQDRYHMLFVGDVYAPPASYTVLTENDLLDVTSDLNPNLSGSKGWYINLEANEKVMARSKTVDGMTLFTTFKPNQGNADSCAPSQGLGRLYAVSTHDARPLHNLDGVGTLSSLTTADRSLNLVRGGIQPEPTLIFTKDDHPVIVVGTEKVKEIPLYLPLQRTSWEDQ